ncbi:AAA family ATPase [Cellulosimicrobium cellulans]|uniref:ATP-dependent nuclease n=1 Tax=Cellulosimicrobium cellulans TaxID=1710 RepID=UPI001EDC83FA|nr:AAA family ATPase [Cellulosimicrobium cellulans]UKJ63684.1 AAA family ATPase [Cellulosimicrobium cellulans]
MDELWRDRFAAAFPGDSRLHDGRPENFGFALDSIGLRGGDQIRLQGAGVTAIVGANNAGKSTVLREVWEKLSHLHGHPDNPRVAVESLEMIRRGNPADVIAWIGEHASFVVQGQGAGFQNSQIGLVSPVQLLNGWNYSTDELGSLAHFTVFYGNAQARFAIGGTVEMRESVADPATHPVHNLQDSKDLFDTVNEISMKVFGRPLTLDTLGRQLRLRVGEVGMETPRIDDIPVEYRTKMASLRPLDEQGDGMRSLMGQLLPILGATHRLIIIDEPEAFLHPPQAHALGVEIGRLAVSGQLQVLVATHDRNFLTGLLESGVDVSVVRLTRGDGNARASQLDAAELRELWADPVLKYTNVLDGLFHRMVVVAEAEGDCAFLAAGLDHMAQSQNDIPRNEILFVPTGGKAGIAKVCSALSSVKVPVVAAPDLDMLNEQGKLRELVEAVGGTWDREDAALWAKATAHLSAPRGTMTVGDVIDAVVGVLSKFRDQPFTREYKDKVQAQTRLSASPWAAVKEHGLSAFAGEARPAVEALLERLELRGIVLVREGELERLAPEVPARKGLGWLQAALAAGAQANAATQAHLRRILKSGAREPSPVDTVVEGALRLG